MTRKQALQQAWHDLKQEVALGGDAQKLYAEQVWPHLLGLWREEPQVYPQPQPFDVSIHTLGTSPEATTLAILGLRASEVYILHTPESRVHLAQIRRDTGLDIYPIEIDKSDVTRLYKAVGEQVQKHPGRTVALDLTSGTKAMSAGMAAAGFFLQRSFPKLRVAYVDNDAYDANLRKPVAGSEKLILLPNPHEVLGDLEEHLARELYGSGEFTKAAVRFRTMRQQTGQGLFDLYATLAEMNRAWHALDFAQAKSNAERLTQELQRDTWRGVGLAGLLPRLEQQRQGLEAVANLLQGQNLAEAKGVLWLVATLLMLGDERRERQPVLAGLYYYRALELILQHLLARCGRDADEPNLSDSEKQAMQRTISAWVGVEPEKINLYTKLGLLDSMALLRVLDNPVVSALPERDIQGYQGILKARNKALLIHGLEVSRKGDLDKLRELARKLFAQVRDQERIQLLVEPLPLE